GLSGPAVATYTAALICDTSVPAWHEGYREMPFLFAGSAAAAAGGLGLLAAPASEAGPARRTALLGAVVECAALRLMRRRLAGALAPVAEPLASGAGGRLLRLGEALTLAGAVAGVVSGAMATRSGRLSHPGRVAAVAAGAALLAGSACTRFGIFQAGMASARDPKYTVEPQRKRLATAEVERDLR
ncbi:polysulfide reductase, partial [Nonomuraea sp. NN258]|nr:polysulfide reductase [Nonomuraea antri]